MESSKLNIGLYSSGLRRWIDESHEVEVSARQYDHGTTSPRGNQCTTGISLCQPGQHRNLLQLAKQWQLARESVLMRLNSSYFGNSS
jgi:hypothetical protein